jgi:uncharacterized protein (DUF302 family)
MNTSEMLIENLSPFGFDETVERVSKSIVNKEWRMPALHDLQGILKNSGKEVLPVKVFEICHPKHSGRILEKDDERIVSSLMPCRISVYMKSDGKTYISRLNAGEIAAGMGGVIATVMKDAFEEMEEIINHSIH